MTLKNVAESLQDSEIVILRALQKQDILGSHADLSQVEFMRSSMYLENKKLVEIIKSEKKVIVLGPNGKKALKEALPELQLLSLLRKEDLSLKDAKRKVGSDEFRFATGYLRKKGWITFDKGSLKITASGKKVNTTPEIGLLKKIGKGLDLHSLKSDEQLAYLSLSRRKRVISTVTKKEIHIRSTAMGAEILNYLPKGPRIEKVTPAVIKSGDWKSKPFRRYDVEAPVPTAYFGKKQPYLKFLDDIRGKMVELGFKEMSGPLIETEFYNFDALYQPQNHPARTWTDTYKLKSPTTGKLPSRDIINAVKSAHEKGGNTGSKGWQYSWSDKLAKQLMPRSHTTTASARQMVKGINIPGKYFTIGRVFRPDVLDATHLIEFNQFEFFVAGEDVNFSNLLGILKKFAVEFTGAKKLRFLPDYYPFTEPSVQLDVWSDELGKWVEFGGAGVFRPELTETLGIKVPVIAGGFGIDRMFMNIVRSKDIRDLFSDNIDWLRKKEVLKSQR